MKSLIERLESAGEGSRELSDECLLARGFKRRKGYHIDGRPMDGWLWDFPDGTRCYPNELPDPSQNVQDAINWLVPEGWDYSVGTDWHKGSGGDYGEACMAERAEGHPGHYTSRELTSEAATPALALSAASLKAIAALRAGEG